MLTRLEQHHVSRLQEWIASLSKGEAKEEAQVELAAFLKCLDCTIEEIATILDVDPRTVNYRIKKAKELDVFIPMSYRGKLQPTIQREILGADLEELVEQWLGREKNRLFGIRVYPSLATNPRTGDEWDEAVVAFSRFAGERLRELLTNVHVMGLTWGRTVSTVVERCLELGPPAIRKAIRFVPTWGEPLKTGENPSKVFTRTISCSDLAWRLHQWFNRSETSFNNLPPPPSLSGVPAIVPLTFDDYATAVVRKLMYESDGFASVFGSNNCLINQLDGLLTSGGSPEPRERFWSEAVFKSASITPEQREQLDECVFGDIGGVWIPKPTLNSDHVELLDKLKKRWLGITLDQMKNCSLRASKNGPPGVITCAIGESRADVIFQCLEQGLINQLIVDVHLAQRLISLIKSHG